MYKFIRSAIDYSAAQGRCANYIGQGHGHLAAEVLRHPEVIRYTNILLRGVLQAGFCRHVSVQASCLTYSFDTSVFLQNIFSYISHSFQANLRRLGRRWYCGFNAMDRISKIERHLGVGRWGKHESTNNCMECWRTKQPRRD